MAPLIKSRDEVSSAAEKSSPRAGHGRQLQAPLPQPKTSSITNNPHLRSSVPSSKPSLKRVFCAMLVPIARRVACRRTVTSLSISLPTTQSYQLSTRQLVARHRRHSSSKPSSSSNDGSSAITTPAEPQSKESSAVTRKRTYSKPSRSRSKQDTSKATEAASNAPAYSLPMVPSTQHLTQQGQPFQSLNRLRSIHAVQTSI